MHGANTGAGVSHDDFACEVEAEANADARRVHGLRAKAPYGFLHQSEIWCSTSLHDIMKTYHNGSCHNKRQGCKVEHINEVVAETEGVFECLEVGIAYTIA